MWWLGKEKPRLWVTETRSVLSRLPHTGQQRLPRRLPQSPSAPRWDQHWVVGLVAIQAFVQTLLGAQAIKTIEARGLDVSHPPSTKPLGPCPLSSSDLPKVPTLCRAQRRPPGREGPPVPWGAPFHQGKVVLYQRASPRDVREELVRREWGDAAAEGGFGSRPVPVPPQSPGGSRVRPTARTP